MIGKQILHYKIVEKLGEGGMGIVYLAEDNKLERKVAIKFLPRHIAGNSDERKRFEIEAKAAAALNHPNIATIYNIEEADGELFLVMEYIEGRELKKIVETKGPVISADAINYATQIAEGLQAAHEKGIVHRDVKSSNIMVTTKGRVKIMDFGLAKFRGSANLTQVGTTVGTAAYMSPEQAKGDEVDHRTDIWAFGVVFYEMLTGELPFKGDYEQAVVYSILNEEPSYAKLDQNLDSIIQKTLSKNKNARYENIEQIINSLNNLFENPVVRESNSIAVLPFRDLSPARDQDYFCEGIAEEILNALSKINDLQVSSRTSSFHLKNQNLDINEIGKKIGVNSILEGSVRKAGDRLRITVQLINIEDGFQLWSDRYDRNLEDVFQVQEEIALNVVKSLKGVFTKDEKDIIQNPETTIEAYEFYLKGRQFLNQIDFAAAREAFSKAIEKDPNYAPAHAGLANTYSHIFEWLGRHEIDLMAAEDHSKKALQLAENHAESHTAFGFALSAGGNYDLAESEFHKAIALDSNSYDAHYLFGRMSFSKGDIKRASKYFLMAAEIRKDDVQSIAMLAQTYKALGNTNEHESTLIEIIKRAEKQLALNPTDKRALSLGAIALLENGQKKKAYDWQENVLQLHPEEHSLLVNASCFYAQAGESEKAIELLEKVIQKGIGNRNWIANDPDYNSLRDNPRFIKLFQKLK